MISHLEELLCQYYQWQGYLLRRNVLVGRRKKGGWECELDIVAYHPEREELLHVEPSLDSHSWEKREMRYAKKFEAGRKHIFKEIFRWLDRSTHLRQVAVFTRSRNGNEIAGGRVITVDEFMLEIRQAVSARGPLRRAAIPEQYGLLRTIQMVECGYVRALR